MTALKTIRNFCIIAHIDHGKTTLTDRILELTSTHLKRQLEQQDRLTDVLEIEQERGITIKLQPATMPWKGHTLNLIDTPGHIDFTYEVSRSMKACEGALLLIDVTQGVQAQTISNMLLAMEADLKIIPILNKVDIGEHLIEERLEEIEQILGFKREEIILASGKTGQGVSDILDFVVEKVAAPKKSELHTTQALVFDSIFDEHKGIIAAIRVFSGNIIKGDSYALINTQTKFLAKSVGTFSPKMIETGILEEGMVGYIATGIKDVKQVRIGDTISLKHTDQAIPGFDKPSSKVFASLFPENKEDYVLLKESIQKLALNDASLSILEDYSPLLGQGYRVGFLGLLHLEITKERLEREFLVDTVVTIPSVEYHATLNTGEKIEVKSAFDLPPLQAIKLLEEPFIKAEILTPSDHISSIYDIIMDHRGVIMTTKDTFTSHASNLNYVTLEVDMPYAELLKGFFSVMKSASHGYASLQYGNFTYKPTELVKVDVYVNHEIVAPLSFLEIPERARDRSVSMLETLKKSIPPHIFSIPLQAMVGGKVLAREDIAAYKKDVTAKLYGGDITRKMKLRNNQQKKKREMKITGKVRIPSEAFLKIINTN
ncbi:elongation factor 4 [bacterium]|nr:elongation factor 4 [bacterium]